MRVKCPKCQGAGAVWVEHPELVEAAVRCGRCNGVGEITNACGVCKGAKGGYVYLGWSIQGDHEAWMTCPRCRGTGKGAA